MLDKFFICSILFEKFIYVSYFILLDITCTYTFSLSLKKYIGILIKDSLTKCLYVRKK